MKQLNFVTFEGIEGCGKSTQVKKLQQFFIEKKIPTILTREPGGTNIGEKIREILIDSTNSNIAPKTELLLNFASRIEHVEQLIKPALMHGKKVISDRFFHSTLAYQGYAMGVDLSKINQIKDLALDNFKPDITFLIDVEVEVAFNRIKNRSDNNRYEEMSLDFHQKVRNGFLEMQQNEQNMIKINGNQNPDQVFAQISDFFN